MCCNSACITKTNFSFIHLISLNMIHIRLLTNLKKARQITGVVLENITNYTRSSDRETEINSENTQFWTLHNHMFTRNLEVKPTSALGSSFIMTTHGSHTSAKTTKYLTSRNIKLSCQLSNKPKFDTKWLLFPTPSKINYVVSNFQRQKKRLMRSTMFGWCLNRNGKKWYQNWFNGMQKCIDHHRNYFESIWIQYIKHNPRRNKPTY